MKPRNPETQGSTCPCLHSTKITSTHHHVGFLFSFLNMVSREIKPSPHACKMRALLAVQSPQPHYGNYGIF